MLKPYNIKIVVYCENDDEARFVQEAVKETTQGVVIEGAKILNFYSRARKNMDELKRILGDVAKDGFKAVTSNIWAIQKLMKK